MNNLTAHFGISYGAPSDYYPADEQAANGALDYDVTITIGEIEIDGGITLYRDDADGGMSPCGSPRDGWVSASILRGIAKLTERSQREILAVLARGDGANGDEIELTSEPTAEDLGARDADTALDENASGDSHADLAAEWAGREQLGADEALINALGWAGVCALAWVAYDAASGPSDSARQWCADYSAGYRARLVEIAGDEPHEAAHAS